MITPPDLDTPFANDSERGQALASFLEDCARLERWLEHAANPVAVPEERLAVLANDLEPGDTPGGKLQRWATLFDDELRAVLDGRNRVVHGIRLADVQLRGATWLARRLLKLLEPDRTARHH